MVFSPLLLILMKDFGPVAPCVPKVEMECLPLLISTGGTIDHREILGIVVVVVYLAVVLGKCLKGAFLISLVPHLRDIWIANQGGGVSGGERQPWRSL